MKNSVYYKSEQHILNITQAANKVNSEKFSCRHCGEDFTIGCLSTHEPTCLHDPENALHCAGCFQRIYRRDRKYCSRTCAAIRNNEKRTQESRDRQRLTILKTVGSLRRKPRLSRNTVFVCEHCKVKRIATGSSSGKYCDAKCQGAAIRKMMVEEALRSGHLNDRSKKTIREIMKELIPYSCAECPQGPEWNGKPLTLDLDHIDGNNQNNSLKNLRFLCPNCHTQTPTWGSKKRFS